MDLEQTRSIFTAILNQFRIMAVYLKPVLPSWVERVEKLFREDPVTWDSAQKVVENCELNSIAVGSLRYLTEGIACTKYKSNDFGNDSSAVQGTKSYRRRLVFGRSPFFKWQKINAFQGRVGIILSLEMDIGVHSL